MARKCTICGRGPRSAVSRSHSNVATKRRQYLNLQTKRISGKKVKLCTRCLRTMKKNSKV